MNSVQPYRQSRQPRKQNQPYNYYRSTRLSQPRRRSFWFIALVGVLLGFMIIISGLYHGGTTPKASAHSGGLSKVPKPSKPTPVSAAAANTMSQKINSIIGQYSDLEISVAITDLNTGASYNYGINDSYEAASVTKLLTASLFLHQVENGSHSLNETINDQTASYELQQMIEQSDNDAWQALNDLLGHDALTAWASQLGLKDYDADANTMPASDVAILLSKLYQKQLLNHNDTQLLLSFMQNANETQYIVSAIPSGVKVYHKAGWLDDRVHDAAIIDNGKNPYVLVIFSKTNDGSYDTQEGQQLFHDITNATVATFINRS